MTSRLRRALLAAAGAAALVAAPFLAAAPAAAADLTGTTVLFFSNPSYTDTTEEDQFMQDGITAAGATVVLFDGGDGSAAAWTAALTGQTVLVIPELFDMIYSPGGSSVMSDEASLVVDGWLKAGGTIVLSPTWAAMPLLDVFAGSDYFTTEDVWSYEESSWPLLVPTDGLPGQLDYISATSPFSIAALAPFGTQSLYAAGDDSVVTTIPFGGGAVVALAWDWYPAEPFDSPIVTAWNAVLQQVIADAFITPAPPAPSPALVATGAEPPAAALAGGLAVLVLGVGIIVARRRAVTFEG